MIKNTDPVTITKEATTGQDPEAGAGANDSRAEWALVAVHAFQEETGSESADAISDLIGDIMHLCDRRGTSFEEELARAKCHYEYETSDDGAAP